MAKVRVAVLFGGRSSEHAISCVSAGSVLSVLDREAYDVVAVGITTDGRWVLTDEATQPLAIEDGVLPAVREGADVVLAHRTLEVRGARDVPAELLAVDVVFPVLHGPWGEDGTIQGLLETAGVPYVGSGVFASAAAMDKTRMKALFTAAGIAQTTYEVVTDRQWRTAPADVLARIRALGRPVFVKPARAGSSVGITRVQASHDLEAAVELARQHDPLVIVEAAVEGAREVECGVLVDADGVPCAAPALAEIVVREGHDFYDFEAKYLEDAADLVVPADLDAEVAERVREVSLRAFDALGCEGLARCDVFVRPDGTVLINEVNTMPGFTPISMYPRVWAASGVPYADLVDRLVQDALRKGTGLR